MQLCETRSLGTRRVGMCENLPVFLALDEFNTCRIARPHAVFNSARLINQIYAFFHFEIQPNKKWSAQKNWRPNTPIIIFNSISPVLVCAPTGIAIMDDVRRSKRKVMSSSSWSKWLRTTNYKRRRIVKCKRQWRRRKRRMKSPSQFSALLRRAIIVHAQIETRNDSAFSGCSE